MKNIRCADCCGDGFSVEGRSINYKYWFWYKSHNLCYLYLEDIEITAEQWVLLMAKSFVKSGGKTYRQNDDSKWEVKEGFKHGEHAEGRLKWLSSKPPFIPPPEDKATQYCPWSDLMEVVTLLFDKNQFPCQTCNGKGVVEKP